MMLLANKYIQVQLDENSAHIASLKDAHGHEWLYHCAPSGQGGVFDALWTGGIDAIFPCDEACPELGQLYSDHGVLWHAGWRLENTFPSSCVLYREQGGLAARYSISLLENRLYLALYIQNNLKVNFTGLFRWHPAFAIDRIKNLQLEAAQCLTEREFLFPALTAKEFSWPCLPAEDGACVDLSKPSSLPQGHYGLVYAHLKNPAITLTTQTGACLTMHSALPWLCLFYTRRGWAGHDVLVPEHASAPFYSMEKSMPWLTSLPPGQGRTYSLVLQLEHK